MKNKLLGVFDKLKNHIKQIKLPHIHFRNLSKELFVVIMAANIVFLALYTYQLNDFAQNAKLYSWPKPNIRTADQTFDKLLGENDQINQEIADALGQNLEESDVQGDATHREVTINNKIPFLSTFQLLSSTSCLYDTNRLLCTLNFLSFLIPVAALIAYAYWKKLSSSTIKQNLIQLLLILPIFIIAAVIVHLNLSSKARYLVQSTIDTLNSTELQAQNNILSDPKKIADAVDDSDKAPQIYVSQNPKDILTGYFYTSVPQSYFQAYVVPQKIKSSNLAEQLTGKMFLINSSKLLVKDFEKKDLQELLPSLAKKIIEVEFEEFKPDTNKDVDFEVLGSENYQEFQVKKQEEVQQQVQGFINSINADINYLKNLISQSTSYIKDVDKALDQLDDDYNKYVKEPQKLYDEYCKGSAFENSFECVQLKNTISINKSRIEQYRDDLNRSKDNAKKLNEEAQSAISKNQANIAELSKLLELIKNHPVNTEAQSGVFFPQNLEIRIKFYDNEQSYEGLFPKEATEDEIATYNTVLGIYNQHLGDITFVDYLETAIHEFLHASSFQAISNGWPVFMEEGMTSYLTTKALAPYISFGPTVSILAYPEQVNMLRYAFKEVDEDDVIDLYFSNKLQTELQKEFEDGFEDFAYDDFVDKAGAFFYIGYDDLAEREKVKQEVLDMVTLHDNDDEAAEDDVLGAFSKREYITPDYSSPVFSPTKLYE